MSFFVKSRRRRAEQFSQLNAEIRGNESFIMTVLILAWQLRATAGWSSRFWRNAEHMSFAEIEKAIADFAKLRRREIEAG